MAHERGSASFAAGANHWVIGHELGERRQGSGADIQVPPHLLRQPAARAHLGVPGWPLPLEDLNSSNGTLVLANGMWEQVSRADVDATTPILLADYQTRDVELLRGIPALM